jgi:hypothetical protein
MNDDETGDSIRKVIGGMFMCEFWDQLVDQVQGQPYHSLRDDLHTRNDIVRLDRMIFDDLSQDEK